MKKFVLLLCLVLTTLLSGCARGTSPWKSPDWVPRI